jgi:cytochrome P450
MNAPAADPYTLPLDTLDPSCGSLFQQQQHWAFFERLRKEDPVHFVDSEEFGPYWSITKFNDIMFVDSHHNEFSSEPMIVIGDPDVDLTAPQFIAMDPPKHDVQRAAVAGAVAPGHSGYGPNGILG